MLLYPLIKDTFKNSKTFKKHMRINFKNAVLPLIVINIIFPIETWFEENPQWRPIFNILVIIGIIGLLAGLVDAKRR